MLSLDDIIANIDAQMEAHNSKPVKANGDRRQEPNQRHKDVPVAIENRQADRRTGMDRRGPQRENYRSQTEYENAADRWRENQR